MARLCLRWCLAVACLLLALPVWAGGGIAGTWQGQLLGQPLLLVLGAGGEGQLDGAPIRYQVQGNQLSIDNDGEVIVYQFHLKGKQLVVSGGDLVQPVSLERAGGAAGKGREEAPATAGGGLRPELVGRWCEASTFMANNGGGSQSSSCIELKGDGSYVYASERSMDAYGGGMWGGTTASNGDSGRWSATRSSITAHSASGQTQTYQLELRNNRNRDPMICLDGTCFVTYWRKAPW